MVRESNGRSNTGSSEARPRAKTKRSPRRTRRHDARRADILKAAARLFRDRGFADAGMRDIADAADLSPANLYHYFGGKDELLFYCQDRALDRMLASAAAGRRTRGGPAEALRRVLADHATTLLDDVEGASAHLQTDALSPRRRRRVVGKRDRYERAVRALVIRGIKRGDFVETDAAIVTRAMLGAINWTATWFRPEGHASAAEVGDTIAGFLVRGLQQC